MKLSLIIKDLQLWWWISLFYNFDKSIIMSFRMTRLNIPTSHKQNIQIWSIKHIISYLPIKSHSPFKIYSTKHRPHNEIYWCVSITKLAESNLWSDEFMFKISTKSQSQYLLFRKLKRRYIQIQGTNFPIHQLTQCIIWKKNTHNIFIISHFNSCYLK